MAQGPQEESGSGAGGTGAAGRGPATGRGRVVGSGLSGDGARRGGHRGLAPVGTAGLDGGEGWVRGGIAASKDTAGEAA